MSWKFTDELSVKYFRICKWSKWIRLRKKLRFKKKHSRLQILEPYISIFKIKRPALNSTSVENAEKFSAFDESNLFSVNTQNSSVIQLINCWLSRNVALCQQAASVACSTDRIKAAAKAVATTTCTMGIICFKSGRELFYLCTMYL